jgi:hypothetical protein
MSIALWLGHRSSRRDGPLVVAFEAIDDINVAPSLLGVNLAISRCGKIQYSAA